MQIKIFSIPIIFITTIHKVPSPLGEQMNHSTTIRLKANVLMQIKIFSISIIGGEPANEELNICLRNKKVLQVENQLIHHSGSSFWSFCIKYLDTVSTPLSGEKVKTDYKQVLEKAVFKRFSRLREIRKQIAQNEAIPAYAVFTDEELAELAKLPEFTLAKMKTIKGIGDKEKACMRLWKKQKSLPKNILFFSN